MIIRHYLLKLLLLLSFSCTAVTSHTYSMQLLPHSFTTNKALISSLFRPSFKAGLLLGFIGASFFLAYNTCVKPYHRKLYASDFASLGVRFLNKLEYEAAQAFYLSAYDHPLYKQAPAQCDAYALCYGFKIVSHYQVLLYLKFVNKKVGYGVFAGCDIGIGEMIGEYTGVIRLSDNHDKETDYAWYYPGIPATGADNDTFESVQLGVDAQEAGNFTRFVNHSYDPNVSCLYVPYEGQWHIIYVARRLIKKDEQLLVNYGPLYWLSRKIAPAQLNNL